MSWWFYEGQIVRIKQEFQTDFGYLFEEQYDKIKAPEIQEFVSEIYEKPYYDNIAIPIKKFPNVLVSSGELRAELLAN